MAATGTPRLPIAGPWITAREVQYASEAAQEAWYDRSGEFVQRFERLMAEHCSRRHAIATPSCTSAIHLALAGLGIGPGDEVVVPDLTWIASAAPVEYVGARTVFADVDSTTWCMSNAGLRATVSARTRAVIPVDLYGGMPRYDELETVAADHGLAVIEDAAEAVGSRYGGRPAGSFGIASVFSFHGSKTVTTGEGGMVLTDDDELHERMLFLRDHGRPAGDTDFYNETIAFKYKMSALQAAVGVAQVERIDELIERKRQIFAWYSERLDGLEQLRLNAEPDGTVNSYWMVTALLEPELGVDRQELRRELRSRGIDTRPFFHPLSAIPAYRDRPEAAEARSRNRNAYAIGPHGLNLPSALSLEEEQVDTVCRTLIEALESAGSPTS